MKKNSILLFVSIIFMLTACGKPVEEAINVEPQLTQVRFICELATMECYYHNVAKFYEEDATGFLFWKKDKHFWIEYDGIVTLGIDVSLVNIEITGSQITITLPEAKVLSCKVDSSSLTEASYIVDEDSAKISAEDEILALKEAQRKMEETVSNDRVLLATAQQRAQDLLLNYITSLSNATGKNYTIKWVYIDTNGNLLGTSYNEPLSKTEDGIIHETQVNEE